MKYNIAYFFVRLRNPVSHTKGRGLDEGVEEVTKRKRGDVTGPFRKQHKEEHYVLHSSPDNVRDNKLKRMRRTERVARTGRGEGRTGFWWGDQKKRNYLEYLGVDWNILLNGSSRNKIGASGEDESGSE